MKSNTHIGSAVLQVAVTRTEKFPLPSRVTEPGGEKKSYRMDNYDDYEYVDAPYGDYQDGNYSDNN